MEQRIVRKVLQTDGMSYTCWMGMIRSHIRVVSDISEE